MLYQLGDKKPLISKTAFISPNTNIIGDVSIGEKSSVWFNSVIRGDTSKINIGNATNIQDNVVIHSDDFEINIGNKVTIGHGSVMHGCLVKDNVLIGMNTTILHGAEIGEYSIVGAGALVPPNYKVPPYSVVIGVPCKYLRKTTDDDLLAIENTINHYEELRAKYIKNNIR